jgi:hypothetical protein
MELIKSVSIYLFASFQIINELKTGNLKQKEKILIKQRENYKPREAGLDLLILRGFCRLLLRL